jgi:hypothetical protein
MCPRIIKGLRRKDFSYPGRIREVRLGTSLDFSEFAARVTSVYENVGTRWKLVHRHADPITKSRPAESMLGK